MPDLNLFVRERKKATSDPDINADSNNNMSRLPIYATGIQFIKIGVIKNSNAGSGSKLKCLFLKW